MRIGIVMTAFILLLTGCSRQLSLRSNEVVKNQTVTVRLQSGQQVTGEVDSVDSEALVIRDRDGQAWRAPIGSIAKLTGPQPVYDGAGVIISEKAIQQGKTGKNGLLFALSGGVLSMGTSFFLSSMLARASTDDHRDVIIQSGTAAGTAVGALLFYRMGAAKDRQNAVDKIRKERSLKKGETDLDSTIKKRTEIQSELEKIRQERARQDEEIKKLQKQINDKQKK